jgi:hypothetical protein
MDRGHGATQSEEEAKLRVGERELGRNLRIY